MCLQLGVHRVLGIVDGVGVTSWGYHPAYCSQVDGLEMVIPAVHVVLSSLSLGCLGSSHAGPLIDSFFEISVMLLTLIYSHLFKYNNALINYSIHMSKKYQAHAYLRVFLTAVGHCVCHHPFHHPMASSVSLAVLPPVVVSLLIPTKKTQTNIYI